MGLSATLPNYKEVGEFIEAPEDCVFYFNNQYRPVPLKQVFIGIKENSGHKFYSAVRDITNKLVEERVPDNQILVFVHSRKETLQTALQIKEHFYQ